MSRPTRRSSATQSQNARYSRELATVTWQDPSEWSPSYPACQQQYAPSSSSSSWPYARPWQWVLKFPLILCRLVHRAVVGVHVRKLLRPSVVTESDPTVIPPTLLACKTKSTRSKLKFLLSHLLCCRASRPVPPAMLLGPVIGSSEQVPISVSSQHAWIERLAL